jgi:uncharacterized protein
MSAQSGTRVKPLFLGSSTHRLYGVYHPPERPSRSAVLLCYPGVQEYNAAHWAFRRLAALLARDGHHVLRFDYFGTGDSAGSSRDGTLSQWLDDIDMGANELRELSGARELSAIGMRLGGALAFLASARSLALKRLLLWEPVLFGRPYLHELELADAQRNLQLMHTSHTHDRDGEVLGHVMPESLRRSIEELNLVDAPLPRCEELAVVTGSPRSDQQLLIRRLTTAGMSARIQEVREDSGGEKEVRERALLSTALLHALSSALRSGAA